MKSEAWIDKINVINISDNKVEYIISSTLNIWFNLNKEDDTFCISVFIFSSFEAAVSLWASEVSIFDNVSYVIIVIKEAVPIIISIDMLSSSLFR